MNSLPDLPSKKVDGVNVLPVLKGKKMRKILDNRYFYYFAENKLKAIRKDKWKYIIPTNYTVVTNPGRDGKNGKTESNKQEEALYNLEKDISEQYNVIKQNPGIANELKAALEAFEQTIKKEARPVGVAAKQ
jgi:arylsulfatase A-like enzyme